MHALARIGKESFPPLLEVLETGHFGRSTASDCILQLHRSGVDVSRAVPALLIQDRETQKYSDSNPHLDLAYALPVLAEDPRFLVAALTNCLRHSNDDVRVEAARALGGLGAEAHPAVPSLVGALNDPVVLVRDAATNALGKIAPEVLEGIEQRQVQEGGGKSDVNPSP